MDYSFNNRELNTLNYSLSTSLTMVEEDIKHIQNDLDRDERFYETLHSLKEQLTELSKRLDSPYLEMEKVWN